MLLAGLERLGLPAAEEVKLISQSVNSFSTLDNMPHFLKAKRKTSRVLTIWDFVRPVETAAGQAVFHKCLIVVGWRRKTDWLAFAREFTIRVCRVWEDSKSISDLYLKEEKHLQDFQQRIVLQASQAEVAATNSAITGLPASASSLGREPLRLWQPGATDAPTSGFKSHRPHECKACNSRVSGSTAYMAHDCYLYLKSHGENT